MAGFGPTITTAYAADGALLDLGHRAAAVIAKTFGTENAPKIFVITGTPLRAATGRDSGAAAMTITSRTS